MYRRALIHASKNYKYFNHHPFYIFLPDDDPLALKHTKSICADGIFFNLELVKDNRMSSVNLLKPSGYVMHQQV